MKIIVKTLSGKQLPLDIEIEWSIRKVKEEIEKVHELKADTLKLIAYGKVLEDDTKSAADYSIKENDFIVAMVQKAKPAPKPKKEDEKKDDPVPAASTTAATNPVPAAQPQPAAQAQPAQPQPAAQAQPAQPMSPEVEAAINELMAISGKPKELCQQALAAAQGIPDVAFEFLMSGHIPQMGAGGAGGGGAQGDYGDEEMGDEEGDGGLGQYNLDPQTLTQIQALVSNPSFPMIRQRMIQDPNFSAQFMQQLQQTQPAIFNAIQQNPGILMSLILGHDPMAAMAGGAGAGGGAGGQPGGAGGVPPGSISVSPAEMESINNLVQLGFTKERAAEAFFACDKNEEMAANFLFEAGAMDEDQATQNAIAASTAEAQPNPNPAAATTENANATNPPADSNTNNEEPKKDDEPDAAGEGNGEGSSLA